jgi:hypothetical protein
MNYSLFFTCISHQLPYPSLLDKLGSRNNVITPTLNTPTVITPTLITPTIITSTLNTSTVTGSLCNSGAFSNPNAVRDCPFNLSRKFFSYAALLFLKLFSAAQQNIFYKRKYYFM